MNKLYKFSPILDKNTLLDAATYVISEMGVLSRQLLGSELPVVSVKIFAHYAEEHKTIKQILLTLGKIELETYTSIYVKLYVPLVANGQAVDLLGIRIPDPYRSQVGCGDFKIDEEYHVFETKYITNDDPTQLVRKAVGHTLNMVELWRPDSDVLGYILAPDSEWIK